jgi:hypothetical protein
VFPMPFVVLRYRLHASTSGDTLLQWHSHSLDKKVNQRGPSAYLFATTFNA